MTLSHIPRNEFEYGNSFIEWFSEEARQVEGKVAVSPTNTKMVNGVAAIEAITVNINNVDQHCTLNSLRHLLFMNNLQKIHKFLLYRHFWS